MEKTVLRRKKQLKMMITLTTTNHFVFASNYPRVKIFILFKRESIRSFFSIKAPLHQCLTFLFLFPCSFVYSAGMPTSALGSPGDFFGHATVHFPNLPV